MKKFSNLILIILTTVIGSANVWAEIFETVETYQPPKSIDELLKPETLGAKFALKTTDPTPVKNRYFAIPETGLIYEINPAHRVSRILKIKAWTTKSKIELDQFLKEKQTSKITKK